MLNTVGICIHTKYWGLLYVEHCGKIYLHKIIIFKIIPNTAGQSLAAGSVLLCHFQKKIKKRSQSAWSIQYNVVFSIFFKIKITW